MITTLVALLSAHFVADFALQSDGMAVAKRRPGVMAGHILIVVATTAVAIGWLDWPLLGLLAITHFAMDAIKIYWLKPTLGAFAIDQTAHFAVIAALVFAFPGAADRGIWTLLPATLQPLFYVAMLATGATIAVTVTGGIVIGKALEQIATQEIKDMKGLPDGGTYIGWLERALTLLFVAIDQPAAVGLLLAAKSILRFGDIKDTTDRARAEYIMIGTFLSVGWALCIAVVARKIALHILH